MADQSEISRLEQANVLGLEYLKAMILLNGGAIIALLTFIGNASDDAAIQFSLPHVRAALSFFLTGICSILLALILSYSYTATNPMASYHKFWNNYIIPTNCVLALISLAGFVIGAASLILGAQAN